MPAAGPEKSEVTGSKACCNSCSSFLQPEPCVISVPQQLGRAFLTLEEKETWEIKQSLTPLLSLPNVCHGDLAWSTSEAPGFLFAVVSLVIVLNNIRLQEHCEDQLGHIQVFRSV